METLIRGRIWKFDHNVDTDVMAPWNTINEPWEERRKRVLHIRPDFAEQVKPGEIIVAGRNWGCGSSREFAPENLQRLGVAAVLAESFGRIYFRNCVAIAFPNVACAGIHEAFEEGDELELDLRTAAVRNLTRGGSLQGRPYAPEMLTILEQGGLMNMLKARMANEELGK